MGEVKFGYKFDVAGGNYFVFFVRSFICYIDCIFDLIRAVSAITSVNVFPPPKRSDFEI